MPNIRVEKRLDKISEELSQVSKHVRMYGGISKENAADILVILDHISTEADRIATVANATEF